MTQVSAQFIDPKVEDKIQKLFSDCIKRCQDDDTIAAFLEDLLTPTEKVMLAKRVAIALMILKGNTYEQIENKLKVSKPTIWKVNTWLGVEGKGYRKLLSGVIKTDDRRQKEHRDALWDAENPPLIPAPGDWKAAARNRWRKAEDTKIPF